MSASSRSRPRSGRPMRTVAASAAVGEPRARRPVPRPGGCSPRPRARRRRRPAPRSPPRCSARRRAASVRSSGQPWSRTHDRGVVEPSRPARVAQPSPRGDHRRRPGVGHRGRGGEPGEERVVHRRHPRHLRLVEHHLRHEDRPAVAGQPPRQVVTSVVLVPGGEGHSPDDDGDGGRLGERRSACRGSATPRDPSWSGRRSRS